MNKETCGAKCGPLSMIYASLDIIEIDKETSLKGQYRNRKNQRHDKFQGRQQDDKRGGRCGGMSEMSNFRIDEGWLDRLLLYGVKEISLNLKAFISTALLKGSDEPCEKEGR